MMSSVEMQIRIPRQFFLEDDELKRQLDIKIGEHFRNKSPPTLERAWTETVYNPQTGGFEPGHFCMVGTGAKMLQGVQVCLEMQTKTALNSFSATFVASTVPLHVREQWGKLGKHLQALYKIDQDLARIGAVQDSGMFTLPGHYMSYEDYERKILPKIREAAESMTGTELLRAEVRCLFKIKPVDLKRLQDEVARLNILRIRAVVEIRSLQHSTRLDVTIPGFS